MLTGDFGKFAQLIARIAGVDRIPRGLREPLAKESLSLTQRSYRRGTDPRGRTWKDLASGGPSMLYREGALFGSLGYSLTSDGFELHANTAYAAIHQYGGDAGRGNSVTIPQRQFLPDGESMPYPWHRALEQICQRYVQEYFE